MPDLHKDTGSTDQGPAKAVAPAPSKVSEKTPEPGVSHPTQEQKTPEKKATERKGLGYWAFHFVNFFGLHCFFNSTTSLLIAYNLLPTKPAQKMIEWAEKIATPINGALMKVTTPIKKLIQGTHYRPIPAEELEAMIAHSARSRVETIFMCIAGFLALWPVKWLEDHRTGFINGVERIFHPGRTKEEQKAAELKKEDAPKETWGNLIRARFIGLGVVFSIDAVQQRFNNWLTYEKGNIDTLAWKSGVKMFDKMPEKIRSWLVGFFARKDINLSKINPDMREHLLNAVSCNTPEIRTASQEMDVLQKQMRKTVDKATSGGLAEQVKAINTRLVGTSDTIKQEVERLIAGEQWRLLSTKEIFLTLMISITIYICAKAPFMARLFEKIGLKKKEPEVAETSAAATAPSLSSKEKDLPSPVFAKEDSLADRSPDKAWKHVTPKRDPMNERGYELTPTAAARGMA